MPVPPSPPPSPTPPDRPSTPGPVPAPDVWALGEGAAVAQLEDRAAYSNPAPSGVGLRCAYVASLVYMGRALKQLLEEPPAISPFPLRVHEARREVAQLLLEFEGAVAAFYAGPTNAARRRTQSVFMRLRAAAVLGRTQYYTHASAWDPPLPSPPAAPADEAPSAAADTPPA